MNRRVLVTGAAGGIGGAVADALLAEGWHVAALDLHPPALRSGGRFLPLAADVTSDADTAAAAERLRGEWGALDALVNSAAAVPGRRPFAEHTAAALAGVLDVNATAALRLVQDLLPLLRAGKAPGIVNVSSIGAARAFRRNPVYCASKGAVEALTRALALDLAPDGIRVNAVAPGMVRTGAWNGLASGEERRRAGLVPLGRPARPEEVAAAVRFLAGPESGYITAAVLPVDGGLAAQAYAAPDEPGLAETGDFLTLPRGEEG